MAQGEPLEMPTLNKVAYNFTATPVSSLDWWGGDPMGQAKQGQVNHVIKRRMVTGAREIPDPEELERSFKQEEPGMRLVRVVAKEMKGMEGVQESLAAAVMQLGAWSASQPRDEDE